MHTHRYVFFGLLFFLVISTNISTLAVDQSLVGIKNGDEYTYVMEKYNFLHEQPNRDTVNITIYHLYGDESTISVEDGDQFTYRIINSTTFNRKEETVIVDGTVRVTGYIYPYAVNVEIVAPNGTVVNGDLGIGFSTILSDTNWTGYKTIIEDSKEKLDKKSKLNPDIFYTFEIIDTNTEFGYKFEQAFSGNDSNSDTYSDIIEIRYEKSTGMANILNIQHIKTEEINNITSSIEDIRIIKRVGTSRNNQETELLPGFTVYMSVVTLITVIYRRRK